VRHVTTYAYEETASVCHNELRLLPRPTPRQTVHAGSVTVVPRPALQLDDVDWFGNPMTFLTLQEPHARLTITATSEVSVSPAVPPAALDTPAWEVVREGVAADRSAAGLRALEMTLPSPGVQWDDDVRAFAATSFPPARPVLDGALDLMHRIHAGFAYAPAATTVSTPVEHVLRHRRGVCQDFAHLALAALRSLGLPARYVSGYLVTKPPPGQPKLQGADASHAWLALFVPGHGWIDLDPTNDMIPSDEHVTVAWGRDYADVSPVRGVVLGGGGHTMTVGVDVEPIP
jgi:transglutaminase-like putative cysteine protease